MTCKKLVIEQKKTLLIMTGGSIGLCVILGIWSGLFGGAPQQGSFVIYCLMAGLACSLVASKMFFDMTSKEGRTSLLMSPATAADKFIPRLIAVIPGMLILAILGYLAYCYSDILALGLKYDIWVPIYNPFSDWSSRDTTILGTVISVLLLSDSLFIFGAVAWPKRSFLKTVCLIAALQIILSFLSYVLIKCCVAWGIDFRLTDPDQFGWSVTVTLTVIAAAVIYASFIKFKRSTLV